MLATSTRWPRPGRRTRIVFATIHEPIQRPGSTHAEATPVSAIDLTSASGSSVARARSQARCGSSCSAPATHDLRTGRPTNRRIGVLRRQFFEQESASGVRAGFRRDLDQVGGIVPFSDSRPSPRSMRDRLRRASSFGRARAGSPAGMFVVRPSVAFAQFAHRLGLVAPTLRQRLPASLFDPGVVVVLVRAALRRDRSRITSSAWPSPFHSAATYSSSQLTWL